MWTPPHLTACSYDNQTNNLKCTIESEGDNNNHNDQDNLHNNVTRIHQKKADRDT